MKTGVHRRELGLRKRANVLLEVLVSRSDLDNLGAISFAGGKIVWGRGQV